MEHAVSITIKAACLHQRDRQRVAKRHGQRGGRGGRHADGTGLGRIRQWQGVICLRGQSAVRVLGDRHHRDRKPAGVGNDIGQFLGLARVGNQDHGIIAGDHAQIAMRCLARMDELRWRTGRGQGRGDFRAHVAGFAHARHDHTTLQVQEQIDDRIELV